MIRVKFRVDVDSPTFKTMVGVIIGLLIVLLVSGIVWLLKTSPFHPLMTFTTICILAIIILFILSIRLELSNKHDNRRKSKSL